MRNKSFILSLLLVATVFTLHAQREETVLGERGWGFSGIWGGYGHQYAQFGDNTAYIRGGFFTFEFGKALTIGWSNYRVDDKLRLEDFPNTPFSMRWNALKLGYAFQGYKAIHPTLGVDLGYSKVRLNGVEDKTLIATPTVGMEINVLRWFRVGLEGGYRWVNDTDLPGLNSEQLSGLYGQANLKFGFSWGRHYNNKHKMSERKKNYE